MVLTQTEPLPLQLDCQEALPWLLSFLLSFFRLTLRCVALFYSSVQKIHAHPFFNFSIDSGSLSLFACNSRNIVAVYQSFQVMPVGKLSIYFNALWAAGPKKIEDKTHTKFKRSNIHTHTHTHYMFISNVCDQSKHLDCVLSSFNFVHNAINMNGESTTKRCCGSQFERQQQKMWTSQQKGRNGQFKWL